jgi:hypothetical protein
VYKNHALVLDTTLEYAKLEEVTQICVGVVAGRKEPDATPAWAHCEELSLTLIPTLTRCRRDVNGLFLSISLDLVLHPPRRLGLQPSDGHSSDVVNP